MASCPKCGKEVADSAVVCKHCNSVISIMDRPTGITVIAVILLIGTVFSLYTQFQINWSGTVILGINLPPILSNIINSLDILLGLYCAIGFFKLQKKAYQLFILLASYRIANNIITSLVVISRIYDYYSYIPEFYTSSLIIGFTIGVALNGWLLFYLSRRKDYFVN